MYVATISTKWLPKPRMRIQQQISTDALQHTVLNVCSHHLNKMATNTTHTHSAAYIMGATHQVREFSDLE
jgi:hypothetical protein